MSIPTVADAIAALERFAPLDLAGDWDNVGLLLESTPTAETALDRGLLCIDLTPAVAQEAVEIGAQLVVSYHPPIFAGLKRIVRADPRATSLLQLIRHGISVHSPHTAADATAGGVNDWLVRALPKGSARILEPTGGDPDGGTGQGRFVTLDAPTPLAALLPIIREHLGRPPLRLATPGGSDPADVPVRTVADCPGAGGSVIGGTGADLLWTGEMRHHDVLAATEAGHSVLLSEHTHTERGYLPELARALGAEPSLQGVSWSVSGRDADPLTVWQGP